MKIQVRILSFFSLLLCFVVLPVSLWAQDLIPPSRALGNPSGRMGKLTVVSEPPGLEVFLDGLELGRTPVWLKNVRAGDHKLMVGGLQADIYVGAGDTKTVSAFQNSLIEAPQQAQAPKQLGPEIATPPAAKRNVSPPAAQKGPGITNWDRFLNGTSPTF